MSPLRLLPVAVLSALVACAPMQPVTPSVASWQTLTASWPAGTKEVIQKMVAKYGPPHEASSGSVVWHNNGPWKRTVIYREEVPHAFPMAHKDVMEQFINYRIPVAKTNDLLMYDGSVVPYRTNGELSARCDKEEANFLAINLAHDVATGRRTVDDARAFYAQAMKAMVLNGTLSPYMQGFIFPVPRGGTADQDRPAM